MIRFLLLALLIAGSFVTGAWYNQRSRVEAAGTVPGKAAIVYACPMHPEYASDRPGDCPACGMSLVAAHSETNAPVPERAGTSGMAAAAGADNGIRQLLGVRVIEVSASAPTHTLRLVGRVVPEETRSYTVNAGIDGFVREVSPVTTGSQVRKGQTLATFTSPEAIPAIQAYLVAVNAMDRLRQSGGEGPAQAQTGSTSTNFQQRIEKLEDLGMTPRQREEMEHSRAMPKGIDIVSPVDGVVLMRNISAGQRFSRGTEWYRIADLSRVWVLADVFGMDADHVRPGMAVKVSVPERQLSFDARVTDVLPPFDPVTRTLKVRVEVENRQYLLRPDMFVDVTMSIARPSTLAVPNDALVDSGLRKVVFVEVANGVFEPRAVETGWRDGDQVEIVKGLAAGARIAGSGTFLLESESRMRLAAVPTGVSGEK